MALNIKQGNVIDTRKTVAGKARDWQSMSIEIEGDTIQLTGVTSINYSETQDTQLNYGIGVYPVSKGFGNITVSADITLAAYELENILNSVSSFTNETRRPQNLAPFNLVVVWEDEDGTRYKDVLYQCTTDTFSVGISQNDMDNQVTLNLNPVGISWRIPA